MQIKKKLNNPNKLYIFFYTSVLFIIIIFSTSSRANTFKVSDLEISVPFDLSFNKEKVIDKGFLQAFDELISMITTSSDKNKVENTKLTKIKNLIDSFTMSDERFIDNVYLVKFDVNFNKKNTLIFFKKNNIFPSIPKKKDLLLIPIIVDLQKDEILMFNNNHFYKNWNKQNQRYYLLNYLLPNEDLEDLEDLNLIYKNNQSIEKYNFKKLINKYDINDYIVIIIYKNRETLKILSKINLNNSIKIDNKKFDNINLSNQNEFDHVLHELKTSYENYWKNINQINTSIKLPITISIKTKENKKIKNLEETLDRLDLVSKYEIIKFDNKKTYIKIIYNGSPAKFFDEMINENFTIIKENLFWEIQ